MYIHMPISKCVSSARRRHHMSYQEVAEGICSREMVIQYEKGLALPNSEIAIQLAVRLQLAPLAFLDALHDDLEIQKNAQILMEHYDLYSDILQERRGLIENFPEVQKTQR